MIIKQPSEVGWTIIIKLIKLKTQVPGEVNDLPQVTRKPQISGDGTQLPDSRDRRLLPHSSTLLVVPACDPHYQLVKKNPFKELPHIRIFKGGSALPSWAKFRYYLEATKGKGEETLTPDTTPHGCKERKHLSRREPLATAAHPNPATVSPCQGRGPLEGQAGGDLPTLPDQVPVPPAVCSIVDPVAKTAFSSPLLALERS